MKIKTINFTLMNRLICLAAISALSVFCYDLYCVDKKIQESAYFPEPKLSDFSLAQKEIKPLPYYENEISRRNIFKQGVGEYNVAKPIPAGPVFKELLKDLRILGIVSGSKKQAIIEDVKIGKAYFLFTGDYLGEIEVKAIYPDRVELEFKGEKINLFL